MPLDRLQHLDPVDEVVHEVEAVGVELQDQRQLVGFVRVVRPPPSGYNSPRRSGVPKEKAMVAKVTSQGLTIPKELLPGVEEVEIRQEGNLLVIVPVRADDPIFKLGQNPVVCGAPDASELHDHYL